MKDIFDRISTICSRKITLAYSTSFSLSIRFLHRRFRDPVFAVYGFVRLADEIVDSFHGYDKKFLLSKFRDDTFEAIEQGISLNPVLNNFQHTVHKYGIDNHLIEKFLESMEADLYLQNHNEATLKSYILGSAEVVGLMCLRIFTDGDQDLYDRLAPFAMQLGSAFQKVNFLRDLKADYEQLGRTYFPGVDFRRFSDGEKAKIQNEIESEFRSALSGIRQLPAGSRSGVYLAYYYYRKLFLKIRNTPAEKVMHARIRIPNMQKYGILFKCLLRTRINMYS